MTRRARWLLTIATALLTGLPAYGAWLLARGRYLEDYCLTRAPLPVGAREGIIVHGPVAEPPWRLRCEWQGLTDVVVTDPVVLVGGLAAAAAVLGVTVAVFWLCGGPAVRFAERRRTAE